MHCVVLLFAFVFAVHSQVPASVQYTLGASQTTAGLAYTFSLPGSVSGETNPSIALAACQLVTFNIPSSHPLDISRAGGSTVGAPFPATGIKEWIVPAELAGTDLVYICTLHPTMTGKITVARTVCPTGQTLDAKTCKCVVPPPTCDMTCASPQILDTTACKCVCPTPTPSCAAGTTYDATKCVCVNTGCVSPPTCTPPQVLSQELCRCGCPLSSSPTCLNGKVLNDACQCACPAITCPTGQTINQDTCKCACPDTTCPTGQTINQDTCKCTCPPTTCDTGKTLDTTTCTCVSGCPTLKCATNFVPKADCTGCVCNLQCPTGSTLNADCTCTSACQTIKCAPPLTLKADCTGCICDIQCPTGTTRNAETCTCVSSGCPTLKCASPLTPKADCTGCVCDIQCPTGTTRNAETCTCVSSGCPTLKCSTNFVPKADCSGCICSLKCPTGTTLNAETCTCVSDCQTLKCATNFSPKPDCSGCVCTLKCDSGSLLNPDTCTCGSAPCTTQCTAPFVLTDKCSCACPSTPCSNGQARNLNTCECPTGCTTDCAAGTARVPGTCECKACPESCATCKLSETGQFFCGSCLTDNFLLSFGKCTTPVVCGPSTYLSGSVCVTCLDRVAGCKEGTCSTEGKLTCAACIEGFTLTDTGCTPSVPPPVCESGTFLASVDGGFVCNSCTPIEGCLRTKCVSETSSVCTACKAGLLYTEKGCVAPTPCSVTDNGGCLTAVSPVCVGSTCGVEGFCASLLVKRQTCAEDGTTPDSETAGVVLTHVLEARCSDSLKIESLIEKIGEKVRENLAAWDGTISVTLANCLDNADPVTAKRQTASSTVTSQVILTGPSATSQTQPAQQGMDSLNSGAGSPPTLQSSEVITDVPVPSDSQSEGLSGGAIAGIIIGCIVGVILLVAIVVLAMSKKSSVDRV